MRTLEAFRNAATGLAEHPQDHGWRDLYRVFARGLERSSPNLTATLLAHHRARPTSSETHLLTLLGIALKETAPEPYESIVASGNVDLKLDYLEDALKNHHTGISDIIKIRQNSFTSARRFLVPQVLLSAYFMGRGGLEARFADFGTGLGILPRQLNSPQQFKEFSTGLIWPNGFPAFRDIPLGARLGVDRGPLPDLDWVHACYGRSEYYTRLYHELLHTRASSEVRAAEVDYEEVDLLDSSSVVGFIHKHKINVANLTYVLYELERAKRTTIVEMLVRELYPPGVLLVSEPHKELHSQGVVVELFHEGSTRPQTLCYVTDGHYTGYVLPLEDYEAFADKYPIEYV